MFLASIFYAIASCFLLLASIFLLLAFCLLPLASPALAAISTVDSSGGAYSSVKLQSNGNPAVAYFDHKTGELKYSYWTTNGTVNQWIRGVVEEKGVTGYVSLWLDSSNKPYISYYHNISKNDSTGAEISGKYGNHMVGALKYAYCATTTCLTPADWTKVTVAQIGQSENGYTGGFSSLAFDSSGNPRIAYYDFSHKIDANDTKKGALKLAYCNSGCNSTANWTISTVDTDGGRSASMVIDTTGGTPSNKVMLSYDADEVQKIRYAESSSPFSIWTKADIDTAVNTGNLFRDTSIAIDPTTGKPRLVYQYQNQYDYGHSTTLGYAQYDQAGFLLYRDAYYASCDVADCTVSTNWTKTAIATGIPNLRGYTSSIKVGSDGKPRIAYHYWGSRTGNATRPDSTAAYSLTSVSLAQDLHYILCGNSACSSGNSSSTIDSTNNTGLYSSIILDSGNNPFISYYNYDSNKLLLYHPTNSYNDSGITANVIVSDTSNGGTGLQSGDSFTILFSGATNGSGCSIDTSTINNILKLSNGHSWTCSGSSVSVQWSNTYNTNDTLTITVTSGTGGCMPTVAIGDRISLDGTCILDGSGNPNPIILQTEIKGSSDVKPPKGAIVYYKMDEGSKYTAYDSAGGNHASLNKGVAWTTGVSGSGVSLDGSDDHLFAPGVPDVGGGKITIEAWLKPNAFGTGYTILNKEGSYMLASNGQCAIATTGTAWAWYGAGSVGRLQRNYSGNKDIWRQVVCTYDSSTGTQKVYIDGILDGTRSTTGLNESVSSSRYPFVMGRREVSTWPSKRGTYVNIDEYTDNSGCAYIDPDWVAGSSSCYGENYWGTNFYNGKMDEVVIYNVALTPSQIEDRFKQLPAQLERADANDTSGLGLELQAGDTVAIRFTNETNAPAITKDNIDTVLVVTGKTWLDGSGNIGSAVWSTTRFTNDTLTITLSSATSAPTVASGDIITLGGGVIKEKTGTSSITGSTKIRGSYDLNGAIAYWDFESNANDTVGQYNNGTANGSPTYAAGKFGNAISLASASSQYVSVSNYPDLNPSNITVEAWVNLSTTGADRVILSKNNQYLLRYTSSNNKFSFYLHDGTDWEPSAHSATSPSLNTWYHIVGTWDGTNQRIYVNGVLENTVTHNFTAASTTNGLEIGSLTGGSFMDGSIDEVVIYNRAITADEVKKRSSSRMKYAVAKDASGGGVGIQSGDTVIITFDAPTAGTSITSANIDTALALSNGHIWGTIQSAEWNSPTNDTLTITLSTTGTPTVAVGDTITLGATIKDTFNRALTGSIVIGGNFGVNLPANGIAYYNFDEQGGTTIHDSIGNNHGTLNNSSSWRTERLFKGVYFDGTNHIDISDSPDFNLLSYTIDAWVKVPDGLPGGAGVVRRIISQQDGAGNYWQMRLEDNKLVLCDSRLTPACSGASAAINDGEWHHLAVVRDNTNNQVILYIDGVADTTVLTAGGGTAHDIAANIQIGRKYDGTNYFIGMVDEIAVYNSVLTATDVQSRYRAPIKSAFTSDTLFNSGIQLGDKVIIRFHGKTNGYAINSGNIGTNLPLSSSHTWGTIQSAVWSSYKYTNDTLTITLGDRTGATLAGNDTITISGTSGIKDVFGNNISDTMTLSKDFDFHLPEGVVGYWKLDETSGTISYDSFETNNGTLYNSPTWTAGKFNNALSFNGTNNYIQNSASFLNSALSSFTMEAWIKTSSGGTIFTLGEDSSGSKGQSAIGISSGKVYGRIQQNNSTTGFGDIISAGTYNDNQWHHIALTYDGPSKEGILYVDGVSVGTLTTASTITLTTGSFRIGTGLGNAFSYFTGYIDDVALYNRALTAGEVMGRYGDYTVTARAYDTSGGGPGIQAGDTVTFKFSGPTNGAVIDVNNIDTALFLSNLHTWKDCNLQIGTPPPQWSNTGGNQNDTLTVTLPAVCSGKPDVAPLDTVSIGSPIGAAYRAFAKSAKIGGLFGDNLPASGNKVAYWTFDEQSNGTAYDAIGDNHGTLNNSFWRIEEQFKGLYFDGSRYVDVPDSPDFNLSSYTIDTWVKVPDGLTTGIRNIISQDDGTNYWRMRLNNNTLELCDSRLATPCNNTATTINDGEWHHLAVVRDDALDKVLFYIDGNNIYTVSSLAETGTHAINANIQIGRKYNGTEYFYGMIDEIVVYNRVLTASEIQSRYRAPLKSAFTSDPYFEAGIQAGKDKVIIRFHGKTNFATAINSTNIDTYLPITGKPGGWGAIQGNAVWSTYPNGGTMTNNTLTITLGTGATIAKGDTITVSGITDMYGNAISDSITLSGDFNLNLPEGAVSYYRFDETSGTTASDSFNGNSGTLANTPTWTTGKFNNAIQFAGPLTYTKLSAGTASAISTHSWYRVNGPQDGQGSAIGTCNSTTSACYTWRANTSVSNEWWKVDFGSSQTMSRIKVYAYTTGTTSSYKVQTSPDNVTWTDRGNTTTNGWTTFDFSPITARYVRVYETANLGDGFLYITEVEVYNDNSGNNYMQVNNSDPLNPERLTVEAWAKSGGASWNATDALVTKSTAYKLSTTSASKNMSFSIYADGAWRTVTFTADGSFDITQWHHYAGTYDGTNLKIYVDGVLKNTTAYTGVMNITDTTNLYIASDNGATSYLNASIDEVTIYNRALTLEEVIGRYGEYSPITAFADDPTPDTSGIQAGDTVTIKFPGPTNGLPIDANNIDAVLALSNLHTWKDGSNQITSAVWSTRVYENDTLTITLSATTSAPTVAAQDTISMGGAGEIGSKYRAVTWSAKISGTFGEALPGTPVAFWKMDENLGATAFDSIGTNDGTLSGATLPAWSAGMFNYGLNFNSNTSYMNVGSITLSGDWSIEGWFKSPLPVVTGSYNSLFGDRRVVVQKSNMHLGTHNGASFVDLDTPYVMSSLASGWHHIAAVGNSAGGTTKFYIDGVPVGTASYKSAAALTTVGNTTAGSEQFGLIDELAVYSVALTDSDVASRYLVFFKEIYAKDTSNGGAGIQNGDQVIVRFDGPTGATVINSGNIDSALQLSGGHIWGSITSAVWSTTYKTNDTLTITLDAATATVAMRDTITLGTTIKDAYGKDITGSMVIGGDFGTNLPDGAVGYWKFDDGTSGSAPATASDSFNDYDGTLTNTPTWTTAGRFNNALQFTGGTGTDADYVVVNNAAALNPGRITVEAWAKSGAATWNATDALVTKSTAYKLSTTSGSKNVSFSVYAGGAWRTVTFTAGGSFDITRWHHYAGTYDGTTVRIYVDGVEQGTGTSYSGTINTSATGNIFIGNDGGTAYLNALIDEVVFYNRALTSTEIRTRYGAGFSAAVADDNSGKGPNIQANDRVVITFGGETNGPVINAGNIDTVLATGKTWKDGNGAIVSAVWDTTGAYANDRLTITLSGSVNYVNPDPLKPSVVVGDTITLNGTITDSSGRVIRDNIAISGSFGITAATISSALADDNSGKGPNIQANDRVTITFSGATNAPTINAGNIDAILPLSSSHSWKDGNNAIVSAVWSQTTNPNDTLTITLSGSANYVNPDSLKPTVVVGDTITVDGAITDPSGKAIVATAVIGGGFGVASAVTPSTAVADDNSGKGPNIQANDRVTITFGGATNAPTINAGNIDTILPVSGKTWLDGNGAIVSASWNTPTNTILTITLSGPATYADSTPAKPTVAVGDTITIDGTITDSTGKAIISNVAITGSFGSASTIIPSTAVANDSSGKGPNIQSGDTVAITFSGATNATAINSGNINTILPFETTLFSYDFTGTSIDTSKIYYGTGSCVTTACTTTYFNQNGNLRIRNNNSAWDTFVYTNATFARSPAKAFQASFYTASGVSAMIGWHDGGTGGSYIDLVHAIYFANGTLQIYEDGIYRVQPGSYSVNTWYDIRIELKPSGGAKYYYKLSSSPTWILLYDSTYSTESNLRPGVAHYTYSANYYSYTDNWVVERFPTPSWLDGNNTIVSSGWTSGNTVLTITLGGPLNYGDTTPASPTVDIGDKIKIDGGIADSSGKAIIGNVSIGGNFGTASSVVLNTAAASDASTWGPNIQSGDKVVLTFSGATNTPVINAGNIDTILKVTGKTWRDSGGSGAIVSAVWDSSTQLTITLSGPATQQDTTPAAPTVAAGDTVVIDGTITDTSSNLIISSVPITGGFGSSSGTVISSAVASDDIAKYGMNTGDKVVIKFNGQIGRTGDTPPTIDSGNIGTVLALNNGHVWGTIQSAGWTSEPNQNDTLTITLGSGATVAVGDTITLDNATIKDKYRIPINSNKVISGDFAIPSGMKAWWKFESNANDSFGSYSGTISGTYPTGRFGQGGLFDATNERLTVTTAYPLTSSSWTIEAWFKLPIEISGQGKYTLVSSDASGNQIVIDDQTRQLGTSEGISYYYVPNYNINNLASGWHHVVAVGSGGSGTAGTTQFYIDGEPVGTGPAPYKSTSNIKYLGNTSGGDRAMGNTIDNIIIYDTALSASTIKNRYGSWPRSAFAYGTAGDYAGITTGDQVVIRFDQATEGNTIDNTNIGTALVLSGGHTWGTIQSAAWSNAGGNTNDTLTITLTTTGPPTVAVGDIITLSNNVIKDHAGRPISDTITLQGSFNFKLPTGAIAYWRFNDSTGGTTVTDSWGSNNGTVSGTGMWSSGGGVYGTNGVTVDASTEVVTLNSALAMPTEWTIIGWLKTPLSGTGDHALTHGSVHEHAVNINSGSVNHELGNLSPVEDPGGSLFRGTGYYLNNIKNGWHHIAAVGTGGSGTSGTTTYYIDGQLVSGSGITNPVAYKAYFDITSIGNNTGAGTHAIGTTIDEISVYNRPLTATEIRQHYGARLKYARAKDTSGGRFGIDAGDQVVIRFDGETSVTTPITVDNIDTVLKLSNGHTWKDGNGQVGSIVWSTTTYTNDTLTITLSTGLLPPTVTNRDTITLDGVTIKDLNRVITGSIDISGDFDGAVAYWDLDEGTGSTAVDSINDNNGTLGGSTLPSWGSGYSGTALNFDDTNAQYVTVPGNITVANSSTTSGSAVVTTTNNFNTAGVKAGQKITGTGIAVDTYVLSVDSNTQLTMSKNATASGTVTLSFISFDLTSYTIEAWVKIPTTIPSNNYMRIISQESNSNPTNYWSLAINQRGQLVMCDSLSAFPEITPVDINVAGSTTTNGSAVVTTTNNFNTAGVKAGQKITGTGIAGETYVASVDSNTQITMSKSATATGTVTLNFTMSYNLGGLPAGQYPKCETVMTKTLNDDKWHFISVVRDTGSGNFKFYIDHGNCAPNCTPDKTVAGGAGSGAHNIAGTVEIGRKNGWPNCNPGTENCSQEYFRGYIDNVAVYNYAMTDAEVNLHHFLYPTVAWASDTSGLGAGIQTNDSITMLFNGETAATAINSGNIGSALQLPAGKSWGTINSASWSQTYYPNDTLKITLGSGMNIAIGDTITLGSTILDVHNNPISGSIAITGSFEFNLLIGVIAYWPFNEGINQTVTDQVGSYSGTLYNGTSGTNPAWIAGKFGYALEFPLNTQGYVNLPTNVPLTSNEWTIEAWVYTPLPTNADNNNILMQYNNVTQHIRVMPNPTNRELGVYYSGGGGGFYTSGYSGIDSLAAGWHHLVTVGKSGKTYFYIDGVQVGSPATYQSNISIAKIGNGMTQSTAEYKRPFGKVDDVVIYNRALSATEISDRAAR